MPNSERYRRNAADCWRAARKSREPHYQKFYLFMAQSWLSFAREDDATEKLLAIFNGIDGIGHATERIGDGKEGEQSPV